MPTNERLDGWKAIAAHFGRDRTTAIRWARERGLPVHSTPGGQTRSVYALKTELDAWEARARVQVQEPGPATEPECNIPSSVIPEIVTLSNPRPRSANILAAFVACGVLAAVGAAILRPSDQPTSERRLPADPHVASLYIQARDDWGQRSARGLGRAIEEMKRVTRLDPRFAPAFAGLADAYLVASEEGDLPDVSAMAAGRSASERALVLDPNLSAAQRARGFIAYWADRNRAVAGQAFRAALRIDAADAQTHFWYASILSDNGEDDAAAREYDAARLINPGSIPIRTEHAWALWIAGQEAQGAAELKTLVGEAPNSEEVHDCLSVIALDRGDVGGYVHEMRIRARLRALPAFTSWVDALANAEARGGAKAALAATLRHATEYQSTLSFLTDPWEAYIASLAGDRASLLAVLRRADAAHDVWGAVGYQRRIAQRWASDREITALLGRRMPTRIET